MERKRFYIADGDAFRWWENQTLYCLHIQQDPCPEDPRDSGAEESGTIMACWHPRYCLGDAIPDKTPEEFWHRMVLETLPDAQQFDADELEISQCMGMLEPYAAWLPLWIYDHSGVTMFCGKREYPFNDEFDSGQVGWIFISKQAVSERFGTAGDWRENAEACMRSDVAAYDQYLTDEIYGYTLYEGACLGGKTAQPEWGEIDSCWGFFGGDLLENGIPECVGHGFLEALQEDKLERCTAQRHFYYTFS